MNGSIVEVRFRRVEAQALIKLANRGLRKDGANPVEVSRTVQALKRLITACGYVPRQDGNMVYLGPVIERREQ